MYITTDINKALGESWFRIIGSQFKHPALVKVLAFLGEQEKAGRVIQPPKERLFEELRNCPYEDVLTVIVGLDAHLHKTNVLNAFRSAIVNDIYDGIVTASPQKIGLPKYPNTLFLNTIHTWDALEPQLHLDRGWEYLTKYIVQRLNSHPRQLVFLLLGDYAQEFSKLIDDSYHTVFELPHPAAVAKPGYPGFYDSHVFSKTNKILDKYYGTTIDW